jgi:protocatechuate 4,5-dioxygenase alpha chain
MSEQQVDRANPIPGTTVFDGGESRRGYEVNRFCYSMADAANRDAFKEDAEAYMK